MLHPTANKDAQDASRTQAYHSQLFGPGYLRPTKGTAQPSCELSLVHQHTGLVIFGYIFLWIVHLFSKLSTQRKQSGHTIYKAHTMLPHRYPKPTRVSSCYSIVRAVRAYSRHHTLCQSACRARSSSIWYIVFPHCLQPGRNTNITQYHSKQKCTKLNKTLHTQSIDSKRYM